jgi:hypothetical protein
MKMSLKSRKETYDANAIFYLKKIWTIFDYPYGQRLQPMLAEYISILQK